MRMDDITLTASQKHWLARATVIALGVGVLFLVPYLSLIIVSAIVAFLFNPTYQRLLKRLGKPGMSASLTLIISMLVIIIPVCAVGLLTIVQTEKLLSNLDSKAVADGITTAVPKVLDAINHTLSSLGINFQLTAGQVTDGVRQVLETVGKNVLAFLTSSLGNFFDFFTLIILYMFVFTNLLRHQKVVLRSLAKLNILGDDLGRLYAQKMGAMTKAAVRGQFVIAMAQGTASALGLYLAGIHDVFFFSLLIFTVLSIIPLGAGIVTMPVGVVMILLGNVWGGVFLIAWHLIVVTNIDNVLRPRLVPKEAALNSALMLLAVFAGLAHFGFLGIILGPVLMIVLVTTIQVFLAVYHREDIGDSSEGTTAKPMSGIKKLWHRGKSLFASKT